MAETQAPRARSRRWDTVLVYVLAGLATTIRGTVEFGYPLKLNHEGLPLPAIGVTVALVGLGSFLSRFPAGTWYREHRARRLVALAFAVMGLSEGALGLANIWPLEVFFGGAHGFAFGLATTFLLALLIEVRPRGENPATAMAWYTAAVSGGYGFGAPIAAWALDTLGFERGFLPPAALALATAALTLTLRPVPPAVDPIEGVRVGPAGGGQRAGLRLAALGALSGGVWLATLVAFYNNFVGDAAGTFFPIYALSLGIPVATIGFLRTAQALAATVVRFGAATLFRLVNIHRVNHLCVLAMALGTAALSLSGSVEVLAVGLLVQGVARGLLRVTSATFVAEERQRPRGNVGMASGLYNAGLDSGTMLGPPVAGLLAGGVGIPGTFRLVPAVLLGLYYAGWLVLRGSRTRSAGAGTLASGEH